MKLKKHGAFLVNFVIDFANTHRSRTAVYLVIQIVNTFLQQLSIQLFQIFHLGKRYTYITADVSHKVLYQSLFVSGGRIAENRLETVMSRQLLIRITFKHRQEIKA